MGTSTNTNTTALAPASTARRGAGSSGGGGGGRMIPRSSSTGSTTILEQSQSLDGNKSRSDELNNAINHLKDIASEQLAESTLLETKKSIFS